MIIEDGTLISIDDNDIDSDGCCIIPYGVTVIGENAFYKSDVKSVIIPNSVSEIKRGAFEYCLNITEITIPYSVVKIEDCIFNGYNSLKAVHISDLTNWCNISFGSNFANPLYFAQDLYLDGKLIKELVIPDGITTIKDSAFECGSFEKIVIPDSVTEIERFAFHSCNSIESIIIPRSVKNIGQSAFKYCSSLSKAVIKGELEFIGSFAFDYCYNLKEIEVCSEEVKNRLLTSASSIPKGCIVILNSLLNKDISDIMLGSSFLNDDSGVLVENKTFHIKNHARDTR